MLSLQGFHCFIIGLLRHCSVLGVDCLFLCVLRHYTISSIFLLLHYPFVRLRHHTISSRFPLFHYLPVSTGILPHSLPEWAFRARPGLWRICLCPKVARIAEQKFGSR